MSEQISDRGIQEAAPDFSATLRGVAAQVLEMMFFDEAVPAECDHRWIESGAAVRVGFDGSHCGEFLLHVSPQVIPSITAAFSGADVEEINEIQAHQVLLELANILCGSVLSQLWPESDLTLAAPELSPVSKPAEEPLHQCFLLPEGGLAISIRMGRGN